EYTWRYRKEVFYIIICLEKNTKDSIILIPFWRGNSLRNFLLKHAYHLHHPISFRKYPEEDLGRNIVGEVSGNDIFTLNYLSKIHLQEITFQNSMVILGIFFL